MKYVRLNVYGLNVFTMSRSDIRILEHFYSFSFVSKLLLTFYTVQLFPVFSEMFVFRFLDWEFPTTFSADPSRLQPYILPQIKI